MDGFAVLKIPRPTDPTTLDLSRDRCEAKQTLGLAEFMEEVGDIQCLQELMSGGLAETVRECGTEGMIARIDSLAARLTVGLRKEEQTGRGTMLNREHPSLIRISEALQLLRGHNIKV